MANERYPGEWFRAYRDIRHNRKFLSMPDAAQRDYFMFLALQADGEFDMSAPDDLAWGLGNVTAERVADSLARLEAAEGERAPGHVEHDRRRGG